MLATALIFLRAEQIWCSARRETDGRERDPAFVSDAYAECYPAYHDYARAVVDSDDEADFSHMDGKAGSGRSRTDFANDEEWQVDHNKKAS